MSYKPFQDGAAKIDCTDLSSDGLIRSLNATVGVAVSVWTFFVHDFGWDVRARFVFDVDDARFLIALQYHFLMTSGKHVVRDCSFCVTMTRAFARYNVGKNGFVNPSSRARVVISVVLADEHVVCGERRQAVRNRLMVWALLALGTYAVSAPGSERFCLCSYCAFESEASWLNKKKKLSPLPLQARTASLLDKRKDKRQGRASALPSHF